MGVKQLIPLQTRIRLKWLALAALDVLAPITEPRVPPRRMCSIGGGDFIGLGESFVQRLVAAGLKPNSVILDIGCGQGRMARPLVPYLTQGRYEGFDIDRTAVEWCHEAYRDAPRFSFQWINAYNSRYNPAGDKAPVTFPYASGLFDAVMVASVFTHMREESIANYISEMARVMEPGAVALMTVFLRDRVAPSTDRLGFDHAAGPHSWTTLPEMPEAAIALEEDWFMDRLSEAGLSLRNLARGTCFHPGGSTLQDFVMVERKPF